MPRFLASLSDEDHEWLKETAGEHYSMAHVVREGIKFLRDFGWKPYES